MGTQVHKMHGAFDQLFICRPMNKHEASTLIMEKILTPTLGDLKELVEKLVP